MTQIPIFVGYTSMYYPTRNSIYFTSEVNAINPLSMIPPCINHHDHTYVKFQRRVSIVYDIIDIGLTQRDRILPRYVLRLATTIHPDRLTKEREKKRKNYGQIHYSQVRFTDRLKGLIHAHTYRYPPSLSRYSSTTASWLANSYGLSRYNVPLRPDRIPTCTQLQKIENYPRRLINSSARGLKVQIGRFNHVVGSWYRSGYVTRSKSRKRV